MFNDPFNIAMIAIAIIAFLGLGLSILIHKLTERSKKQH